MAKKKSAKTISMAEICAQIDGVGKDVESFNNGKQAPGSRIRKALQAIVVLCKQMRKDISEIKNAR